MSARTDITDTWIFPRFTRRACVYFFSRGTRFITDGGISYGGGGRREKNYWPRDVVYLSIIFPITERPVCRRRTVVAARSSARQIAEDRGSDSRSRVLRLERGLDPAKGTLDTPSRGPYFCRRAEGIYHPRKIKVILHREHALPFPVPRCHRHCSPLSTLAPAWKAIDARAIGDLYSLKINLRPFHKPRRDRFCRSSAGEEGGASTREGWRRGDSARVSVGKSYFRRNSISPSRWKFGPRDFCTLKLPTLIISRIVA